MAERLGRLGEAELERALRDLGQHLAYPPTPNLVLPVRQRLAQRPARRLPWSGWWPVGRRFAVALAALLALASAALLAFEPGARTAVAERLGLRGVWIERLPLVPAPTPTATAAPTPLPTPTSIPLGARLELGEVLPLQEARARVPYPVVVPSLPELGAPDEVYLSPVPAGGQVALVYRARPGLPPASETGVGLLLTQFVARPGTLNSGVLGKGAGPDTRIEETVVNGGRGVWLEGQPHLLFLSDARGQLRQEPVRLAGNVLLWEQGELTLRLEAAISKAEALRIATSVR